MYIYIYNYNDSIIIFIQGISSSAGDISSLKHKDLRCVVSSG